ncbi:MAG: hypothetical protein ACSHXK_14105 [Oceanococcus sp.]
MSWDEARTAVALVAVVVSFASLYFSRRSWERLNRPIVTAFIAENDEDGPAFDLRVSNTGNRPALNVYLAAPPSTIDRLLEVSAENSHREDVHRCFSKESAVPVLRDGETLATALGWFDKQRPWLNYGAEIEVELRYSDLDGKFYISKIPLKIFAREGFGGSVWRRST